MYVCMYVCVYVCMYNSFPGCVCVCGVEEGGAKGDTFL